MEKISKPPVIKDSRYRYDCFENNEVLFGKKGRLPAMGWNSWNAFGSGNTQKLTETMAEKIVELGLDKLGYQYIVLDDGCYGAKRVDGHLTSDEVKFPDGFMHMSDFIHDRGLKFGMYNDIGSRLCSGLEVGTCGYEETDAQDYIKWKIDYIKVDNCYNVWDNATFSNPENARYTFAPDIKKIRISSSKSESSFNIELNAVSDGCITGRRAFTEDDHVTGLGTFDGTGPDATPIGEQGSTLVFKVNVPEAGEYQLTVYASPGRAEGCGEWLQVAVGEGEEAEYFYDDLLVYSDEPCKEGENTFKESSPVIIYLQAGENTLRLMNHRRQENTLLSYAKIQESLKEAAPDNDIVFSICEWGKTQPQNWGYKVGDSWRILNDITFQVGSDGDSGHASWEGAYTTSVTAQYNKAVIMDEFAGLSRGWNDPDMLMIGMNGLTEVMNRTHMTMWCMLNSPIMLGMDLRNVNAGDEVHRIISNTDIIALNQDSLGIQAKRIYTTKAVEPDKTYLRDNDRIDVLAKPLADGSLALSFINVSMGDRPDEVSVNLELIRTYLEEKMEKPEKFFNAKSYEIKNLWTKEVTKIDGAVIRDEGFKSVPLAACDNLTIKVTPDHMERSCV